MKKFGVLISALAAVAMLAGCNVRKDKPQAADDATEVADSTVYGVCGEGTSMHSLELVTDAGDTLVYMVNDWDPDLDPDHEGTAETHVEGGLMAGDKMAVTGMKSADGELMATRVINVTSLLGHWTSIDRNFEIEEGGTVRTQLKAESNPWASWKILNGRLLLGRDTFDITSLSADSLYIENQKGIYTFKRAE